MKSSGDKGGRRVASHHWAGVVVALLLHSCSAVPEPRGLEVFRGEFRDLEAFCPDGMRSYWYRIQSTPDGTIREFRCGTNFKLLTLARVEYEGVTVEDHGDHGVDSVRLAELGRLEQRSDGLSLWRREGAEALYPRHPGMEKAVATVVDGRYVVMATSEDLLVAALQKPRAARTRLPASSTKARRLKDVIWSNRSGGLLVAAVDADTDQLLLWSPVEFGNFNDDAAARHWGYQPVLETNRLFEDGWHYLEMARTTISIEEDPGFVERTCEQFFGIVIVY